MKHVSVSCLIIFLITLTFIFGCKKDNTQKDYSGNYSFTTTPSSYPDTVIHYDGSIYFDKTSKVLTINYFEESYNPGFPSTISPNVDDNGILFYPDWTQPPSGYFFNGNIDYDGNINFKMGLRIIHHGDTIESSRTVKGKKK